MSGEDNQDAKEKPVSASPRPQSRAAGPKGDRPDMISDNLRRLYDSVADEPLPDAFNDLLAKLKKSEGRADEAEMREGD